jgi:colanic acid biosynthesis glycosyl transferase WcaI
VSVVFLNRFYAPDVAATAQMLSDLAEDLAADKWHVTVIAGRTSYDGTMQKLPASETLRGVEVARVAGTRFGRASIMGRLLDYVTYFALSFFTLLRIPRPDVIVAMSDPPFILLGAVVAARLRGSRVVYWAQDIYPALAARLGILNESGIGYRFLNAIAHRLLAACDLVVGLGAEMLRVLVKEGARPERSVVIHNWADEGSIRPIADADNWFLKQNSLEKSFLIQYSGNAGRGHTFSALCEVMRRLRNDDGVLFLFIGGGKKSFTLQAFVAEHDLRNVRFMDYVDRKDLAFSLSAADVSLVTEDPSVSGLLVPSKTYGILASGRPIIFIGSEASDVAAIVRDCHCGIVVGPEDADSLEAAIRNLRSDRAGLAAMGRAARTAAENRYSRRNATRNWSVRLRTLAQSIGPTRV